MNIEYLEECILLSQTLNYAQTARQCFISQPVLSKHIVQVESIVGTPLFSRSTHHVRLTPAGEIFIAEAKKAVNSYKKALQDVDEFLQSQTSSISVAYLPGIFDPILVAVNNKMHRLHPSLHIDYYAMGMDEIEKALTEGSADIIITAISSGNIHELIPSSSIYSTESVYKDRFYLVLNPQDSLSDARSICLGDLKGRTLLIPMKDQNDELIQRMEPILTARTNDSCICESITDINSLPILLEANRNAGIALGHLARYYNQQFAYIPLEDLQEDVDISLVWNKDDMRSCIQDFIGIARQALLPPPPSMRKSA